MNKKRILKTIGAVVGIAAVYFVGYVSCMHDTLDKYGDRLPDGKLTLKPVRFLTATLSKVDKKES